MNPPKVAIITRTKDRPLLLSRAVKSVLNQTYKDWIHIIVNDSDDKETTDNVIKKYENDYAGQVKIIHNPKSAKGPDKLLNLGIVNSESEYILIHDDDDSLENTFLQKTVEFLGKNNDYGGVTTYTSIVLEKIEDNGDIKFISKKGFNDSIKSISLYGMMKENLLTTIGFLYRRSCAEKVGLYNEFFEKVGDWEFGLRFLSEYDIGLIPETLANYHQRIVKQSSYSNSILYNTDYKSNVESDTILHNYLLRKDMNENKVGIGVLMNIVRAVDNLKNNNYRASGCELLSDDILFKLKNKRIVFYGAGTIANKFVNSYCESLSNLNIIGFIDQNAELWGKNIGNYKIFSPENIKELEPDIIIPSVLNKSFVMSFIEYLIKENNLSCEVLNINIF